MAKDAKAPEEGTEAPKKSKKLLIIILAAVFLLVIAGGGAAFFLMKKKADPDAEEDAEEQPVKAKPKKKAKGDHAAIFVNLDPFTVNLVPETGDQYLQVALSLQLDSPEGDAALKSAMPKIRNDVMLLLTSKKASELQPKEGKEKLAADLRDAINSAIEPPAKNRKGELVMPEGPVQAVLFTSFIIQ